MLFVPWWAALIVGVALIGSLLWTVATIAGSKRDAESATEDAQVLADQVTAACERGEVQVGGRNICAKAAQVKNGEPGAPGEQGPPGPRGGAGAQGPKGDTGPAGAQGPKGADGKPGQKGDTGPAGQPGADGKPGSDGKPGAKGDTGASGSNGAPGQKGDTGATGAQGPKGDTGPAGPKGDKGDTGSRGVGVKSVQCLPGGDWEFTLTDDTTVTVSGPCRVLPSAPPNEGE